MLHSECGRPLDYRRVWRFFSGKMLPEELMFLIVTMTVGGMLAQGCSIRASDLPEEIGREAARLLGMLDILHAKASAAYPGETLGNAFQMLLSVESLLREHAREALEEYLGRFA